MKLGDGEAAGARGQRERGGQGGPDPGLVQVDAADAGGAEPATGSGSSSSMPSGRNPMSAQSSVVANRSAMPASRAMISGKFSRLRRQRSLWCCARWPRSAGRARLWCRPSAVSSPKRTLNQRQAVPRFLDHDCLRGRAGCPVAVRPVLQPEQGPQRRDVQPGPGPVQRPVEQLRPSARRRRTAGSGCTRPGRPSRRSGTRWPACSARSRPKHRHAV